MRKLVFCVTAALLLLSAAEARAQWMPLQGRLLVSVNGGGQSGSGEIDQTSVFQLYGEEAQIQTHQDLGGGGVFDIGASYRVGTNWGFGIALDWSGDRGDATVTGALPNPLYFDRPRAISATQADLKHDESAVHLQAAWFVPFTDKVDFVLTAGPTIFRVKQEFAGNVAFTEIGGEFDAVNVTSVAVARLKETAVGFNLGADMNYAITKNFGAGVLLRYSHGSVGFDLDGGSSDITAGGFQIGVGARVRF